MYVSMSEQKKRGRVILDQPLPTEIESWADQAEPREEAVIYLDDDALQLLRKIRVRAIEERKRLKATVD